MLRFLILSFCFHVFLLCHGQQTVVDFDAIDSLIASTPDIELCKRDGKEDLRFFSKTPEKYSNYKQEFMKLVADAFTFDIKSHFHCEITVEIDCKGKAGNYRFAIEPRTFKLEDFEYFTQLIVHINRARDFTFKRAFYLGEDVNSKVRVLFAAKEGKLVIQ